MQAHANCSIPYGDSHHSLLFNPNSSQGFQPTYCSSFLPQPLTFRRKRVQQEHNPILGNKQRLIIMEVEKADKQEGRFKLKEWNSVVMWSWNTDVDTCAICRSKLMTLCIDCQAKVNSGEKGECKVGLTKVSDR